MPLTPGTRLGVYDINAERLLATSDQSRVPYSWSIDGRRLLYSSVASQGNVDLWIVPMVGERTPWAFAKTPFREAYGVFSQDGLWVAYQSNESGRPEVYVRPVVPPGPVGTAAAPIMLLMNWKPEGKK